MARTPLLHLAVPLLRVAHAATAEAYYRDQLGFRLASANRADVAHPDPCYMGFERDGVWLHVSSFPGDGAPGTVANVFVDSVDALFAELLPRRARITLPPTDQTWGTREMYVADPDGNVLRFIQDTAASAGGSPDGNPGGLA